MSELSTDCFKKSLIRIRIRNMTGSSSSTFLKPAVIWDHSGIVSPLVAYAQFYHNSIIAPHTHTRHIEGTLSTFKFTRYLALIQST